ncbi:hypothetical protein ES702_06055 [subsurface metagenome]
MLDMVQLLALPFLTCLTMIGILGYLGIHVLKREIIFIDIAVAQAAAVGSIIAHVIFKVGAHSPISYVCALGFTFVAAIFYSLVRRKVSQIPLEAIIGVSYAVGAAAALFLIAVAAGGHTHVGHMLTGSILWAKWSDILLCAIVFSTVGFLFYLFRIPFGKISNDYDAALRGGMMVTWWDCLFYALFGIVITVAVRIAGVLVAFAFLIIPATVSALFSSRGKVRLVIAWIFGVVASVMGLIFSYCLDFSVGASVVSFLGLALVIVAVVKRLRPYAR